MRNRPSATQLAARLATTLATAAALCFASPASAGYVLSFVGSPTPAYLNDTVSVDVQLANDPAGLAFLAFDLLFDPTVLAFQSASGAGFFASEFFAAFEGAAGSVSTLVNDDFLDPVFGDGSIATFIFKAIGVGSSGLDIDPSTAFALDGTPLPNGPADRFDISGIPGSVVVESNGVPLPGTALLAGLGLALLGWQRRAPVAGPAR